MQRNTFYSKALFTLAVNATAVIVITFDIFTLRLNSTIELHSTHI